MKILWNITRNEIKTALHNRLIFLFILFSLMTIPLMNLFNFFSVEQEMKIIKDFTFSIVSIMGVLLSIFYPIYSIKEDFERKYIFNVLSKPVSRMAYVFGKYIGSSVVITLIGLMNFLVLYILLAIKGAPLSWGFVAASFMLMVKFYVLISVSVFLGILPFSFHLSSILAVFIFILGTIKSYILTAVRFSDSMPVRSFLEPFLKVFPNFQYFDVYETVITGMEFTWNDFMKISGYACCYVGVFLLLTWLAVRKKEI